MKFPSFRIASEANPPIPRARGACPPAPTRPEYDSDPSSNFGVLQAQFLISWAVTRFANPLLPAQYAHAPA